MWTILSMIAVIAAIVKKDVFIFIGAAIIAVAGEIAAWHYDWKKHHENQTKDISKAIVDAALNAAIKKDDAK